MAQQGKKIDDRTRAALAAALTAGENPKDLAKAFGVSESTVRRIRDNEVDLMELGAKKREIIALTMDEYLEQERERAQTFISKALDYLCSDEKLALAPLNQIATAMGIVIDKWGKVQAFTDEAQSGVVVIAPVKGEDEGGVMM